MFFRKVDIFEFLQIFCHGRNFLFTFSRETTYSLPKNKNKKIGRIEIILPYIGNVTKLKKVYSLTLTGDSKVLAQKLNLQNKKSRNF